MRQAGNLARHNDPRQRNRRPCGGAVVCRLASLGHDVVAMVRDVQAASRRLPSGIALRVAHYEDAPALKRPLACTDDMVLISSDGGASAVMRQLANAIEAATAANITFTGIVDTVELSPFYFSPNEIFWPSLSEPRPARSTALMWTNTSLPPSSGCMKPKPFVALNRLTVPVVILTSPRCANARCPHDPRASSIRFHRCLGG